MNKTMPQEVIDELSVTERILAHFDDGYDLPEEDQVYYEQITLAFKTIHSQEDKDRSRDKLKVLFPGRPPKWFRQLIDDVTIVYGDFFVINREAMRVLQEKKHDRVFEAAMRHQDFAAAERAAQSIDKLNRLYELRDDLPTTNRKLRKVVRTNNPDALDKLKEANG